MILWHFRMEHHPLLRELLDVCSAHDMDPAKAYTTFDVFQELSLIRNFSNLTYHFNENLKIFFLSGKEETTDESDSMYIPVMHNDEITPQEMIKIQQVLSPVRKQFYLFIQDRDSSSTCYGISRGLVKPDSPDTCRRKKEIEKRKYHFEKSILAHRKMLYMKALKEKKAGIVKGKLDEEQKI